MEITVEVSNLYSFLREIKKEVTNAGARDTVLLLAERGYNLEDLFLNPGRIESALAALSESDEMARRRIRLQPGDRPRQIQRAILSQLMNKMKEKNLYIIAERILDQRA
ncbi:MAG TPA: hypothetical protein VHA30_01315 [Patescibacteria group bacterium]|nr:hypothetical protein [Patescibacteria group bacterium]